MSEKHKDVLHSYLSSEKKLQRYKKKLTELEKTLYDKTKEYIEARAKGLEFIKIV